MAVLTINQVGERSPATKHAIMERKLSKKDFKTICKLADKLNDLRHKYEVETDKDVLLPEYSVGSNLGCSLASLDTILQYYDNEGNKQF